MHNPFQTIEDRLNTIEALLLNLNQQPKEQPEQPVKEELLTVQEAAKFLNLTVPTVYTKVSRSELPVMKRSKRLYFSSIELMDYLKQGRNKTVAETAQDAERYLKNGK